MAEDSPQLHQLLKSADFSRVCQLARAAGQKILEFKSPRKNLDASAKADGSPVTAADLAANQIILDGLSDLKVSPDAKAGLPILSEESLVDWSTRKSWRHYWLVDPLDGTKDFINGTGDYTVNIALISDGSPIWGVVYLPEKDQLFSGGASFGAFLNDHPLARDSVSAKELTAIESHFHSSEKNQEFYRDYGITRVIKAGSSLKFCRVATGEADVYPRLGPTSEWDTAAGQAVLEGAGGQVLTWPDLQPMKYHKEDLLNPEFIAVGARKPTSPFFINQRVTQGGRNF